MVQESKVSPLQSSGTSLLSFPPIQASFPPGVDGGFCRAGLPLPGNSVDTTRATSSCVSSTGTSGSCLWKLFHTDR